MVNNFANNPSGFGPDEKSPFGGRPEKHPAFSLPPVEDSVDALVNEVLDAEGEGRSAEALAALRRGAKHPGFGARLASMRAAVRTLNSSTSPELLPAHDDRRVDVLTEVDVLRPFLSGRRRRQVSASRLAVAASLVLTASLVAVFQRSYPGVAARGLASRPVGGVMEASKSDMSTAARSLASVVKDIQAVSPAHGTLPGAGRANVAPLMLGSSRAYEGEGAVRGAPDLMITGLVDGRGGIPSTGPTRRSVRVSTGLVAAQESPPPPIPLTLLGSTLGNAAVRPAPMAGFFEVDADGVIHFSLPEPEVIDNAAAPKHLTK